MDGDQPYATPAAPVEGGGGADARVVASARGTRPWLTLVAIMATLVTGLIFLAAILMTFTLGVGGMPPAELAGLGAVYVMGGLLYGVITWRLWSLRSAIGSFLRRSGPEELASMVEAHRRFWRTFGLMVAVVLLLYALMFVAALVFGLLAGLGAAGGS